jgi:hypothetical protein
MNHDEQDKLWELLGKAREPKAAPFFASKVLRAIREEPVGLLAWLRRKWIIPATAVACVQGLLAEATSDAAAVGSASVGAVA